MRDAHNITSFEEEEEEEHRNSNFRASRDEIKNRSYYYYLGVLFLGMLFCRLSLRSGNVFGFRG